MRSANCVHSQLLQSETNLNTKIGIYRTILKALITLFRMMKGFIWWQRVGYQRYSTLEIPKSDEEWTSFCWIQGNDRPASSWIDGVQYVVKAIKKEVWKDNMWRLKCKKRQKLQDPCIIYSFLLSSRVEKSQGTFGGHIHYLFSMFDTHYKRISCNVYFWKNP